MLENTSVILHARNIWEPTLSQLKKFIPEDRIIIIDDASWVPIPNAKFRFNTFSGRYEDSMSVGLPLIDTKYVVRVNGGDDVLNLKEPLEGHSCWLSRIEGCPDHNMDPSIYPAFSTSILSGSVIKKDFYDLMLTEYNNSNKRYKFGAFCGDKVLKQENIERSEIISLRYKSKLWRQ